MSSASPTIFVTMHKYVAITPSPLPKIRPAAMSSADSSSGYASSGCGGTSDVECAPTSAQIKGKKRRLDHLTWEEKVQRKKLKNRVAAQTSRDRKKARMEDMENVIDDLSQKSAILENKCKSLQAINESLLEKNRMLDMEVEILRQQLIELQQQQSSTKNTATSSGVVPTCAGYESILNGSAVSTDPRQQGSHQMDSQSTQEHQQQQTKRINTLWRIVVICLLYKTCSSSMKNSMSANWKSLPKVYSQISQQTWRRLMDSAMKLLPKLQADQSDCLDQWWGPQQSAWNPANIAALNHPKLTT